MDKKKKSASSADKQPMEVIASKEEKELISWEALQRPYQKKDKEFWTTVISVLALVSLILFFVREWFLITALVGLVFFYYVLTTVKPEKNKYKITNKGVYLDTSQKIAWEVIKRFWTTEKWGHPILHIETYLNFPRVFSFVLADKKRKEIIKIMKKYVPEEKDSPQFVDKFSSWLNKKLPVK